MRRTPYVYLFNRFAHSAGPLNSERRFAVLMYNLFVGGSRKSTPQISPKWDVGDLRWERFGAPFWKYFGGRWPPFWVYFGGLGAFWLPSASLGRNREHYPFPGARFWVQVGLQKRAKIDKKSMLKSIKNMMPFKIEFWTNFGRFLEGKWSHDGTREVPKMDLILKGLENKKTL